MTTTSVLQYFYYIIEMAKKIYFNHYQYSLFGEEGAGERGGSAELQSGNDCKISELDTPLADPEDTAVLKYISFGSGSSGNCSYLGNEEGGILIDAGVDMRKVVETLQSNGISPESIKGICLTHDHSDHVRYVYAFLRKYKTAALFCTNRVLGGIFRRHSISRRIRDYHVAVFKEIPFKTAGFEITAFEVPHDGTCNSGFSVSFGDSKFVIATDLGAVTDRARHYMSQADYLVIESNYDAKMLETGPYPEYLKNRIKQETGHLDNSDAAAFVAEICNPKLKYVFLCHLSEDNNSPEVARRAMTDALSAKGITVGEGTGSLVDRSKDLQLVVLPRYDATRCYKFHVAANKK